MSVPCPPLIGIPADDTMVLTGPPKAHWLRILPEMVPLNVYRFPSGEAMVRWRLSYDAAFRLGLGVPRCQCGCGSVLEDSLGYVVDTSFNEVGWYFDSVPWELSGDI